MATAGQQEKGTSKLIVVAMDFGTTFSGYAFSFSHNPLQICANKPWGSGSDILLSLKTPTCVLLTPDQEFHSFGYEAEDKYMELAEDGQHSRWYFFRRFKMMLHNTSDCHKEMKIRYKELCWYSPDRQHKPLMIQWNHFLGITERTLLRDIEGKQLPAVDIFAHSIRYLKEHFQGELKNQTGETFDSKIQYVLTVPAIWDDKAKIFMRKAAIKAGIPSELLRMALEPEAASLWCQVYAEESHVDICKKFVVVDLGGGTADIAIQERNEDGTLKELHQATGGSWGGTNVDDNFENLLSKIYGEDVLEELKVVDMEAYISILRSFETQKRSLKKSERMTVIIPAAVLDILKKRGRDTSNQLEASGLTSQCIIKGDKLKIDMGLVRGLFREPIDSLISHLKYVFQDGNVNDVGSILLVGGFAESLIVQEATREAFPNKKIIIPSDCGLAVLKGAVRFGHFPRLIAGRKSKFSYGLGTRRQFDPSKHPESRKIVRYDKYFCDTFREIVAMGEDLPYGREFTRNRHVIDDAQTIANQRLYASQSPNTSFVDEEGCFKIGQIRIKYPQSDKKDDKKCRVSLIFWDTEIKFRVEVKGSKEVYEKTFDRL